MDSRKHLPALDGVRGLAVLIVVLFHYGGGAQSSNRLVKAMGVAVQAGWSGVTLFFILSGFLITGILWDSRGSRHWWKNFYMRRLVRIAPLYYLALLLVVVSAFWAGHGRLALSKIWIYALYLQNVPPFIKPSYEYGSSLWLSHFWSLAVEEQFYLVWPYLIARARSASQLKAVCLGIFVASLVVRWSLWKYAAEPGTLGGVLPSRMGELAIGAFLALCFRDRQWADAGAWSVTRWAPGVAVASLLCFVGLSIKAGTPSTNSEASFTVGVMLATIFWASFVVLSLGSGWVNRAMRAGWLRWVGGISYGVYVYHVLLTEVTGGVAERIAPHAGRSGMAALKAVVMAAVVFPLSWASYRYFEAPILRLRKRFQSTVTPAVEQPREELV